MRDRIEHDIRHPNLLDAGARADSERSVADSVGQRLVSRLRKVLPDGSVEGQPNGYRLNVAPDDVDAVRFERLVTQARDDGDPRLLREALSLWRGRPGDQPACRADQLRRPGRRHRRG